MTGVEIGGTKVIESERDYWRRYPGLIPLFSVVEESYWAYTQKARKCFFFPDLTTRFWALRQRCISLRIEESQKANESCMRVMPSAGCFPFFAGENGDAWFLVVA